ncbi:hypothetical protein MBLNU457_7317t1 [Dothideomycetes sp. NU457]
MPPPLAAKPTKQIFDPFNSSATGHQRADNRLSGSTSWRDSRFLKLREQFSSGSGGGKRVSDTVGAGSQDWGRDGRLENGGWERGAKGLRGTGQMSLGEAGVEVRAKGGVDSGVRTAGVWDVKARASQEVYEDELLRERWSQSSPAALKGAGVAVDGERDGRDEGEDRNLYDEDDAGGKEEPAKPQPQIFKNLTIYINGSTAPTISDHKLKHLLVTHGANVSIALGRRTVTHVVLGHPSNASKPGSGAGGGLAGTKIQKEIARVGGKGVKFVSVEWVIDSIRKGVRVPESSYECLRLAPKGVKSVGDMFRRTAKK